MRRCSDSTNERHSTGFAYISEEAIHMGHFFKGMFAHKLSTTLKAIVFTPTTHL